MKKLITIMLVLCVAAPTMAEWIDTVVSDESTQIIGIYNKGGATPGDMISVTDMYAVRVQEPDPVPTNYVTEYDGVGNYVYEATASDWDMWTDIDLRSTGADWIWETERSDWPVYYDGLDPLYDADAPVNGRVVVFEKHFDIPGDPTACQLLITADNCYEVYINGYWVGRSSSAKQNLWELSALTEDYVGTYGWTTVGDYDSGDFLGYLKSGDNYITVVAGNEYYANVAGELDNAQPNPTEYDPYKQYNPAGMIFALDAEYEPSIGNPAVDIEKYVGIETCSDNCCKQNRYQYNHQCGQPCGQQYSYQYQWCNQCGGCNNTCEIIWYDADEMTGPTVKAGETVYWRYVVENIGDVDLTGVTVWDDNGTDDEGDDFMPVFIGVEVGDEDDILEVGEIWIYEASGVAVEGQYTNLGDVTTDQDAYDEDPANYFGEVVRGDEGCTPGFWKNNAKKKGASAWVGYSPGDYFSDVFGVVIKIRGKGRRTITDPTLLQALDANGSGINLLARAAVAALLNASNPDVAYALTESEVIAEVQDAVASGRRYVIQNLGNLLDRLNNGGCPLNQNGKRLTFNNCYNYNSKNKKSKWR